MSRITKIEHQKKNPKRWSVFLEGKYAFGLNEEVLYKYNLKEGQELEEKKIEQIIQAEIRKKAKESALKFLSYRMRSEKEIRDRLRKKGFSEVVIIEVIRNLRRINLIDDYQFALAWIRDRISNNPRGKTVLRQELWKKGVKEEFAKKAIDEYFKNSDEELYLAKKLAGKRKKRYEKLEANVAKRRMVDFLRRRGFSYDIVRQVLKIEEF